MGKSNDDRSMYPAVCDNCGKKCEVPFKPTGDKPVYCQDCFQKMRQQKQAQNQGQNQQNRGGAQFNDNEHRQIFGQLASLNSKLDRVMNALGIGAQQIHQQSQQNQPATPAKDSELKTENSKAMKAEKSVKTAKSPKEETITKKPAKKTAAKKPAAKKKAAK